MSQIVTAICINTYYILKTVKNIKKKRKRKKNFKNFVFMKI